MRFRLTKQQIEMLIEGKELIAGRTRIIADEKAKAALKGYQKCPVPGTDVYYNTESGLEIDYSIRRKE